MRKIVVLVMSCNLPFFQEEERVIRTRSYGKAIIEGRYPGMEYWSYTASYDDKFRIDRKNRTLYVPADDTLLGTYEKTRLAIKMLDAIGVGYDYIMRLNTSTFLNPKILRCFVDCIPEGDIRLYGETVWIANYPYESGKFEYFNIKGDAMLIPKYWCDVIKRSPMTDELINRDLYSRDGYKHMDKYRIDDTAITYLVNVTSRKNGFIPEEMFYTWMSDLQKDRGVGYILEKGLFRHVVTTKIKADETPERRDGEQERLAALWDNLGEVPDPESSGFYSWNTQHHAVWVLDFYEQKITYTMRENAIGLLKNEWNH